MQIRLRSGLFVHAVGQGQHALQAARQDTDQVHCIAMIPLMINQVKQSH